MYIKHVKIRIIQYNLLKTYNPIQFAETTIMNVPLLYDSAQIK